MRANPARLTALVSTLLFLDVVLWLAAVPLLPRWERELGLTKSEAGIVLGAYSLSILVFSLPLGRVADRIGAKRLTVAATVLFAVTAPALALADEFGELVAVRVTQGLFAATTWTAGLAWVIASAPPGRRARYVALTNASASVASFVAPVVGGPLVAQLGLMPVMAVFSVLVAVVAAWAVLEPDAHGTSRDPASTTHELRRSLRSPKLRASFAAVLFIACAGGALQLLAPLHLSDEGLSDAGVGWVFTATALVGLGTMAVLARGSERFDPLRAMATSCVFMGLGHAALALGPPLPAYIGSMLALSLVGPFVYIFVYALCAAGAEEAGVGSGLAIGAVNSIWAGGTLVAPIAAGALASFAGDMLPYALVAAGAVVTAASLARTRRAEAAAPLPRQTEPVR
jgi:DHA1 family multidrug resistance protein-like MFS transporter